MPKPHLLCSIAALLTIAAAPRAQQWRAEKIADVGIEIEAPGRLERLPMQLGEQGPYQRARFRPKDDNDFVRAQYYWYCDIYEFSQKDPKGDDSDLPPNVPEELKEKLRQILSSGAFKPLHSFQDWLDKKDQKKIEWEVKGKARKGRSGKLDFTHWVWREDMDFGPVKIVYCEAAVYDFGDREVALVIEMPLETLSPPKPKSKFKRIIDHMIPSGRLLDPEDVAGDVDEKRDQYANTPERREALAAAKQNIAGLQGWDLFTAPNYIVMYSWDFEKPDERKKSKRDAEYYSSRLEKMREMYLQYYPLDASGTKAVMPDPSSIPSLGGPITGETAPKQPDAEGEGEGEGETGPPAEKLGTLRYPVFRLCATYDQFQKYGQSPPGVVGWFSPASKELVVFLGGDQMMGSGATETVTYHEGWHQYADFYFDHPDRSKHDDLHRWFDEGHGDFFGSFRWSGSGWKYLGSKMRYDDCKQMVRAGDFVPFKDLVYWDRRKFYGNNAPYYYAQAFSMIDFLRRGEKARGWQARYGEVLDLYRKVMLVKGDAKLAVDTAFRGFTDADWAAIEEAWKGWVGGPNFSNGR